MAATPCDITAAILAIEGMIAGSPSFQEWTGSVDASAASAFVHRYWVDELTASKPLVCIGRKNDFRLSLEAVDTFGPSGTFVVRFVGQVSSPDKSTWGSAIWTFDGYVGGVIEDLRQGSGGDNHLAFRSIVETGVSGLLGRDDKPGLPLLVSEWALGWGI